MSDADDVRKEYLATGPAPIMLEPIITMHSGNLTRRAHKRLTYTFPDDSQLIWRSFPGARTLEVKEPADE
jgi:hypothetical protein